MPKMKRKGSKSMAPRKPQRALRSIIFSKQEPEGPSFFPFNFLPLECQLHVFSFLSESQKCLAALVCRSWSQLICTPRLWRVADFRQMGAFQCSRDSVVVSSWEFERWKDWAHHYSYHLTSRCASLLVLRASFDLGNPKTQWADFLLQFLEGVNCRELRELDLNWTLTYQEPVDFCSWVRISTTHESLAKVDQVCSFQTILEKLIQTSPNLTKVKLPFDWSERSVSLLMHFQHLSTLELKYFWVFKGVCPRTMRELIRALPKLKRLTLDVLVPLKDLGICYPLESSSLEYLNVSQSRGLVFSLLNLPALQEMRVKKVIRGITFSYRTKMAIQSQWPCLYDLIKSGAPKLQVLNQQRLLPHWREECYMELTGILQQACYCLKHSASWLL
ncbi:uncharacterized protein SI:DKEY-12E7.1 [Latimeria chalumnae]|uniref:Si:dkey-12e7.1 n=1 Tax=Latimeria chalumnae TaxID=7897 RepID=H2ZW96_LATCH|nr:PREDICTED: uncharacterized protein LOC102349648 [Latimeria chalumnae]|eukprot:XP_005999369.1 PREDICTED: uncharacterized protein LOC102349648 [Latimeria chalumnae]